MEQTDEYLILLKQIRRLARALDVQSRRIDREVGLTLPQLVVLTALGEMGEVTSRALSARADISPPTVVGILDKLEAKGLIQRYRSRKDRRIVHALITERGHEALLTAPDPLGARISGGFRALSASERATVLAGLSRLGEMAAAEEAAEGGVLPEA
ncbi:MarR family winged helix-turn-helix transcriptional regulator [Pararhodobacter sp.]|uniref:MarR family winged helix-turn-helix transcriptional regulator n=1 Tax=Pararhodobacter sp. TaxID=2127056 RepID=UPI002FDE94E9